MPSSSKHRNEDILVSNKNKMFKINKMEIDASPSNDENSEFATLEPDLNAFNDMKLLIGCVSPLNIQQEDQQIRAPYGFSFICHPVAGTSRAAQCLSVDFLPSNGQKSVAGLASPHVNLTDVQISKVPLPINGRISPWIDCDHPNKEFAEYSMQQLDSYELPNADYLGFRSVVIEIKKRENPDLLRILNKWLWKRNSQLVFWIVYPSSLGHIEGAKETDEIWSLWADFRQQLQNPNRLIVGIKFGDKIDQEFVNHASVNRWKGEPLNVFWFDLDSRLHESDEVGRLTLKSPCRQFFNTTFYSVDQKCLISTEFTDSDALCLEFLRTLRISMNQAIVNSQNTNYLDSLGIPFDDQFQAPLRPAENHLSSSVYSTFEKHRDKYELYGKAILHAATDLFENGICSSSKPPIILVVGAGRGGLVEQVFKAEAHLNEKRAVSKPKKWTVLAIEKNPFAVLSLEALNRQKFGSRAKIIRADARDIKTLQELIKEKPDLVVSEMLGSFGCNEVSPEILECVETVFCHERTIMIPQSYSNFVEPIHSLRMLQSVGARQSAFYERLQWQKSRDPNCKERSPTEQFYVVPLNRVYRLLNSHAKVQKCFSFFHPNCKQQYSQQAELLFDIDVACDVTGFSGYFEATLYRNHYFSILPGANHKAGLSWFPIYIPLQEPVRCPAGSQLKLKVSRCRDEAGVWYEWQESVILNDVTISKSAVQNQNGKYDFMRLADEEEKR